MIDVFFMFAPETSGVLAAALGVFFKATALLVLALVIRLLLGSRRPMVRSALWNSCLIGLVLLPLMAFVLPRLRVDCLPELQDSQAVERNTASVNGSSSSVETTTSSRLPIPEPAMVPAEQSPPAPRFDASVAIVAVYVAVVSLLLTRLSVSLAGIAIPRTALVEFNGGAYCYRVINSRAIYTSVTTGNSEDSMHNNVEVMEGLKDGEIVIVNPAAMRGLETGGPVEVESVMEDEEADSQPRS